MNETYLGDGVYAQFDGYMIWLDTHAQHPVNRIALEPQVYEALTEYVARLRREAEERIKAQLTDSRSRDVGACE